MVPVPCYNLSEMYDKMIKNFNLLVNALKKHYGQFKYFRVYEPHKDGVPHFHILFMGENCIPTDFRSTIEKLWKKYGQGFVRVNVIRDKNDNVINSFNDVQHAINYLLKYLTKNMISPGKYKRIFSAARGILTAVQKKEWEKMVVVKGHFDDKGNIIEKIIWDDADKLFDDLKEVFGESIERLDINKPDLIMDRHLKHLISKEI